MGDQNGLGYAQGGERFWTRLTERVRKLAGEWCWLVSLLLVFAMLLTFSLMSVWTFKFWPTFWFSCIIGIVIVLFAAFWCGALRWTIAFFLLGQPWLCVWVRDPSVNFLSALAAVLSGGEWSPQLEEACRLCWPWPAAFLVIRIVELLPWKWGHLRVSNVVLGLPIAIGTVCFLLPLDPSSLWAAITLVFFTVTVILAVRTRPRWWRRHSAGDESNSVAGNSHAIPSESDSLPPDAVEQDSGNTEIAPPNPESNSPHPDRAIRVLFLADVLLFFVCVLTWGLLRTPDDGVSDFFVRFLVNMFLYFGTILPSALLQQFLRDPRNVEGPLGNGFWEYFTVLFDSLWHRGLSASARMIVPLFLLGSLTSALTSGIDMTWYPKLDMAEELVHAFGTLTATAQAATRTPVATPSPSPALTISPPTATLTPVEAPPTPTATLEPTEARLTATATLTPAEAPPTPTATLEPTEARLTATATLTPTEAPPTPTATLIPTEATPTHTATLEPTEAPPTATATLTPTETPAAPTKTPTATATPRPRIPPPTPRPPIPGTASLVGAIFLQGVFWATGGAKKAVVNEAGGAKEE